MKIITRAVAIKNLKKYIGQDLRKLALEQGAAPPPSKCGSDLRIIAPPINIPHPLPLLPSSAGAPRTRRGRRRKSPCSSRAPAEEYSSSAECIAHGPAR